MSKEAISTERALKLALEAAYLAGWNASGEGYNAEYPFGDHARNPEEDAVWVKDRDNALQEALAQDVPETNFRNTALDKMAENARELGLDYEPAQETDQSVMYTYPSKPEPIPCGKPIGILMKRKGDEHMKLYPLAEQPEPDGVGGCAMCGAAYEDQVIPQPAQQEPVAWTNWRELVGARHYRTPGWEMYADKRNPDDVAIYTSPPAQPAQRKPLTLGQKQRLWSSVGDKPTLKDRVNAYGLAIEAAHGIKGNT